MLIVSTGVLVQLFTNNGHFILAISWDMDIEEAMDRVGQDVR